MFIILVKVSFGGYNVGGGGVVICDFYLFNKLFLSIGFGIEYIVGNKTDEGFDVMGRIV